MTKSTPPRQAGRKGFDPKIRERVIVSAEKAMDALGLEGLKARPIAERAGISVGSIYNLFGDLDALIRILNARTYDDLFDIETRALEKSIADGKSPKAQLLALAEAYLDFVESRPTRWLAALSFNRSRTEPPPAWYLEKELSLFRIIEDALTAFPGAKDDLRRHLTARALWASIHGIVTIAVADGFLMQPIKDVRAQIGIIVNAVADSLEEFPES